MAFIEELRRIKAEMVRQQTAHPWTLPLQRLRGTVDHDGVERITTQAVFDVLEVPQKARTPAACSTLARLMQEQGWSPVRVRGLTRGGFREQVRGYARDASRSRRSLLGASGRSGVGLD